MKYLGGKLGTVITIIAIIILIVTGSSLGSKIKVDQNKVASEITSLGVIDVYGENNSVVGYVDVQSATRNGERSSIDIEGTLYVYVPEGCTPILDYNESEVTIACIGGPTLKTNIHTKQSDDIYVRILTNKIDVAENIPK